MSQNATSVTLSEALEAAGFVMVLGEAEVIGGKVYQIGDGIPSSWDQNNGTCVVHDEQRRPWIHPSPIPQSVANLLIGVRPGTYVPHSNDGGRAIRRLFPQMFERTRARR